MTLLPEVWTLNLYGRHYLISHGDEMCTDDAAYQRFRRIIRLPWLKKILLALPQNGGAKSPPICAPPANGANAKSA